MALLQEIALAGDVVLLRDVVALRGVGLHTGEEAQVTLRPWQARGWWLKDGLDVVPLASAKVVATQQATTIQLPSGRRWMTTEHVFAALSGLWLDRVCIELSGPNEALCEMPALDGSALPLVEAILNAAAVTQGQRRALSLTKPISIEDNGATLHLKPSAARLAHYALSYAEPLPAGAHQAGWNGQDFAAEIAGARTFAFKAWVVALQARGLIRGGSLDCAVVFDKGHPLNPEGLRWHNEPARHKILDLLGDLALLGAPLLAQIEVTCGGHGLHAQALRALRPGEVGGNIAP